MEIKPEKQYKLYTNIELNRLGVFLKNMLHLPFY